MYACHGNITMVPVELQVEFALRGHLRETRAQWFLYLTQTVR